MKISQIARRDIVDAIVVEQINWAGRLEEPEFLSRIFDLSALPSTDSRFKDAAGDIWQHRINNPLDWENDWVFYDHRFNLTNCDDDLYLRFLCETIHPVVRPDVTESQRLCQLYNSALINDGFEIVEKTRLSGRPVYIGRYVGIIGTPGLTAAKRFLAEPTPHTSLSR
jgi:hypothetical protein